ncbi:MAG: MMPL family transporter [Prolixibacteraceae bacterium]|nr:MMPL family transporter [Prolixibacteraceae bacterium]
MWQRVSSFILRYRFLFLALVVLLTLFMGYQARNIKMSYQDLPLLPKKDEAYVDYDKFLSIFGEEGNIIVIGVTDDEFFKLDHFKRWQELCSSLAAIEGVEDRLDVSSSYQLVKNTEEKRFDFLTIFDDTIQSQQELDSLAAIFKSVPIYRHYLYNDSTDAYLVVLTMNKEKIKTREREALVLSIRSICKEFEADTGVKVHYSGLPYINVMNALLIKKEIFIFMFVALAICLLILFLFFKSFKAMFVPALVVVTGVINAMGTMAMFGYEINILTGMIPTLLIVIGIPNSIFMINKYHNEYRKHQNKMLALKRVIQKIGNAIFLTNLTTACGFATFITTRSVVLKEFGIIASINIFALFFYSVLLIPIIFSFLAPPQERHMKHLDRKGIERIINKLVSITLHRRKTVYVIMFVVLFASIYGITRMKTTGYMVDDIPKKDPIYKDLHFFEENFDGIMPLEIIIDTKKPNGILLTSTMRKLEQLDEKLKKYDELSSSLSFVNVVKLAKQAFFNGNEIYYSLPSNTEKNFIMSYVNSSETELDIANAYVDSTMGISRVSIRMKDVGTKRMDELYNFFMQDLAEIFPEDKYDITVTGSSVVFFRGNQYLVGNLFLSIALAITVISIFMAFMFYSRRMVFMSLIPNVIPLLLTAAIMGYTGIPIKASTLLVFSVAFGISVDNTIHFLAKYRQELNATGWNIGKSVLRALRETGVSMIYTSTVLFFGFAIFTFSKFGGTQAMGSLVAITLLVALISNLILLPSLLIGLERKITTQSFHEPMLQIYNEEEDINLDKLEIEESDKKKPKH